MSIMSAYLFRDKLAALTDEERATLQTANEANNRMAGRGRFMRGLVGNATTNDFFGTKRKQAKNIIDREMGQAPLKRDDAEKGKAALAKQAYWQGVADVLDSLGF